MPKQVIKRYAEGVNVYDSTGEYGDVLDYCTLWDSINRKTHPWSTNPWVWVLTFKKL